MATRSAPIDLRQVVSNAATLEIKLLKAGVEAVQVYLNQASQFSRLAAETLEDLQHDNATLPTAAKKWAAFGREGLGAYTTLAHRLGSSYYDELERIAERTLVPGATVKSGPAKAKPKARATATAPAPRRRAPPARKK